MKKAMIIGLLLVVLATASFAALFEREADARTFYNAELAKPKFLDVEITNILSELDANDYVVTFRWKLYDTVTKNNAPYAEFEDSVIVSKSLTNTKIEEAVTDKATAQALAYLPPKPTIQHTDNPLFNKKISVVIT